MSLFLEPRSPQNGTSQQLSMSGYITATPLPSFVDGETSSWLRLRSPSEEAMDIVRGWKESSS